MSRKVDIHVGLDRYGRLDRNFRCPIVDAREFEEKVGRLHAETHRVRDRRVSSERNATRHERRHADRDREVRLLREGNPDLREEPTAEERVVVRDPDGVDLFAFELTERAGDAPDVRFARHSNRDQLDRFAGGTPLFFLDEMLESFTVDDTHAMNFAPEQYHELVDINLGHPGEVARTRQPMLLRDTALHASFVKILQSFRAGSSMFAPILWQGEYLGVLICANAARNSFGEADLIAHRGFAALAASLWVAQGGPGWMAAQDLTNLPRRSVGT